MNAAAAAAKRGHLRQALAWLIVLTPALFLINPLRHFVESQMALHMLVQWPLLVASGWLFSLQVPIKGAWSECFNAIDMHGLLGVTIASCVLTFWMVPAALDWALLADPMRWAKYTTLWLAGLLLGRSVPHLHAVLEVFFTGMWVWMMATVGLIYQSMPQRLCVSYLVDEQRWTGAGLVVSATALGLLGVWRVTFRWTTLPKPVSQRACARPPAVAPLHD
jgi:hypothetical protein